MTHRCTADGILNAVRKFAEDMVDKQDETTATTKEKVNHDTASRPVHATHGGKRGV